MLGQIEVFGQNCSGTPRAVPYLVADKCSTVSGAGFQSFNCSGSMFQLHPTAGCRSPPFAKVPFLCSNTTRYSCAEYPDNKAITFELGGGCNANGTLASPYLEVAVIVNTCLQDQRDASQGTSKGGYFRVTVDGNGKVLYTAYSDSSCTIGETVSFQGKLDACETIPGGTPSISAVMFRTIAAGANIERTSSATSATLNLVLSAVVVMASILSVQ